MNQPRQTLRQPNFPLRVKLAAAVAFALPWIAGPAISAAQPARGVQGGTPRAAAPAAGGAGLDGLDDHVVMSELAARGQDALLGKLFEINKTPKEEQQMFLAVKALEELSGKVNNARRLMLITQVVEGMDKALPTIKDPQLLSRYAGMLVEKGIEPDINTLEYWGESSATQQRVHPLAVLADKMLRKVGVECDAEIARLGALIKNPNDPRVDQLVKLDALSGISQYATNMCAYYVALTTDVSGNNAAAMAARDKVAKDAIDYLKQFDNPDSTVQSALRVRLGKLNMARGDFATSKKIFDSVVAGKDDKGVPLTPAPTVFQQSEARYFSVLSDVLGKKPDVAAKAFDELVAWQKANLPPEAQKGTSAAAEMLRFRILSGQADATADAKQKEATENQAAAVLTKLGEDFPEFKPLIIDQLVGRLPDTAKLDDQPALVLQALMARGVGERNKDEKATLDMKVFDRGLKAAQVLSKREPGKEGLTAAMIEDAALAVPLFYDRAGKDAEAVAAYLDFAKRYSRTQAKRAGESVDRAFSISYKLNKANPTEPAVKQLYSDALSIAAQPPYSRKELAFLYAEYLRKSEKVKEALAYYRSIPAGDPTAFAARFWELYSLNGFVEDPKTTTAERDQAMSQMTKLIDVVRGLAASAQQNDTTKFRLNYTTTLGADLALRQKNPDRTLQLLTGFDEVAKGSPNAEGLIGKARFLRTNAYIAKKDLDNAVKEVQSLASQNAMAAVPLVKEVLDRLGADFEIAQKQDNKEDMALIASNQAALTGYLVNWSGSSTDPKIKALADDYKLYDATIKLKAATLQPDPVAKKQAAGVTLAAFESLRKSKPDNPGVQLGIAYAQFELQDYVNASSNLGTLLRDGKVGRPQSNEVNKTTGEYETKDNDTYWEATYKWLKSNWEQAKANPTSPDSIKLKTAAQQTLKELYITHRERIGGSKWGREYEEFRKEIIPDFVPSATPATPPTTIPASLPVARGAGV